ncbi:hypothetical protein ACTXT7_016693 [Hymenolepis weldensis]
MISVWCKRQLPQAALHTVMVDVHAPDRYRQAYLHYRAPDEVENFICKVMNIASFIYLLLGLSVFSQPSSSKYK